MAGLTQGSESRAPALFDSERRGRAVVIQACHHHNGWLVVILESYHAEIRVNNHQVTRYRGLEVADPRSHLSLFPGLEG